MEEEKLDIDVVREIVSMVRYSLLPIDHYTRTIKENDCNWFYSMRVGKAPKKGFSVKKAVLLELWRRNTIYKLISQGVLIIGGKEKR